MSSTEEPTEVNSPSAFVAALDHFTIYSPEHGKFTSRNGSSAVRVSKSSFDEYCRLSLVLHVPDTNKIRFSLDTGAVVYRHTDNSNLHGGSSNGSNPDSLFELIPRTDGTFYIKADNSNYVSVYDSGGLVLRASKSSPDKHCIFKIETVT
ncbi:hypothetical protein F5H01DRAFT_319714 [Linnemannia elongata]|nr:hypothetical protein F5H01DRAFT_319714 [Linnemannia elongata]